jgi:(2R)-3-sulfolactate dehydrogenase (NADP+)
VPRIVRDSGAACLIDAGTGLGFEPAELAVSEATRRAQSHGIGFAAITNGHHCGALGILLEPSAARGMVALAFSTAPAAIPPWGGKKPLFGTNPVAAVFPRREASPLVIDLSLTQVTRGRIMLLQKEGKAVPEGWGMDKDGTPTTDPDKILYGGSLYAIGGLKGTMLALAVELICCALTGAALSHELESFYLEKASPLRLGQAFMAIDPRSLAGNDVYSARVDELVEAMLAEEGVRLPGERRRECQSRAEREGIEIGEDLLAKIRELSTGAS